MALIGVPRSLLFVSGAQPERFEKATATAADLVCIDLEDAVPAQAKTAAREAALGFVKTTRGGVAIRINALSKREGLADILALSDGMTRSDAVLIPMVENAAEIGIVSAILGDVPLIPLIETPEGLAHAHAIAAMPHVCALMFGGADFAAAMGIALEWEPLFAARTMLLHAAARAGVGAIDVPHIKLQDDAGLAGEAARIKALGFAGKAAIHPRQVDIINRAFCPADVDIAFARAALDAFAKADGSAIQFQGRLVEAPLAARYRKLLADVDGRDM